MPTRQHIRIKFLFAAFALVLGAAPCRATHYMGGDLSIKKMPNGDYKAILQLFRDSSYYAASLSPTELVKVFKQNNTTGSWDSLTTLSLARVPVAPGLIAVGSSLQFEQGQYEASLAAAGFPLTSGSYRFTFNNGSRNLGVSNAPGSTQSLLSLYTVLKIPALGTNSTPVWTSAPVVYLQVNQPFRYYPGVYDADGDSVTCTPTTPLSTVNGDGSQIRLLDWTPLPAPASDSMSFVPATGMLAWTPSLQGRYQQGFLLKEYRNGVLLDSVVRDFQYIALGGLPALTLQSTSANVQHAFGGKYDYAYYTPGVPLTFQVTGSVIGTTDSVFLDASGALLGAAAGQAQFTTTQTTPTAVTGTVAWMPPAGTTGDKVLYFRARNADFANGLAVILRPSATPPPSQGVTATADPALLFLVYPNPAQRTLHLNLNLPVRGTVEVQLTSLTGQVLHTLQRKVIPAGRFEETQEIDLPAGLYIVVLLIDGTPVATQPLQLR